MDHFGGIPANLTEKKKQEVFLVSSTITLVNLGNPFSLHGFQMCYFETQNSLSIKLIQQFRVRTQTYRSSSCNLVQACQRLDLYA